MAPSNNDNGNDNDNDNDNEDLEAGTNGNVPAIEKDQLTNDNTSVTNTNSVTNSQSNSQSNSNSRTNKSRGSVLVRLDSSVLEMASSIKDEYDRTTEIHDEDRRKAKLCCLFCCDLVMACIVVDVCDIILTILMIIASVLNSTSDSFRSTIDLRLFMGSTSNGNDYAMLDDDELLEQRQIQIESAMYVTVLIGCGIIFSIIGIVGALRFQRYMVLVTGIWFCVDFLRGAITFQWLNAVIAVFFAYPHFALFHALQKGKITRDNYEVTEKHCCCECCER